MIDATFIPALIAGLLIAMIAGAVGCFVVWRKMAYFGDSISHSALLGVALGFVFGISTNVAVMMLSFAFALLLFYLQQKKLLATDTLLGILAHTGLSLGLVTVGMLDQPIDLHAYLFGDLLTVGETELWWIGIGAAAVLALLVSNWSSMVLMTVNEDLARAENVPTFWLQLLLLLLMTAVVAVSVRTIGVLLISSMLIIPAATAQQLARSPESMALISVLLGCLAVVVGLHFANYMDAPTGPSIVVSAALLFIIASPLAWWRKTHH